MEALVLILQFSSKFKIDQHKTFLKAMNKIILKIDHWSKGTFYFYLVVTPIKKKSKTKIKKLISLRAFVVYFYT